MKTLSSKLLLLSALSTTVLLCAGNAQARNSAVENEIKNRPELSTFYQALVNTGTLEQLSEYTSYSVFAPTNDAFAELTAEKYPCLYSTQCQEAASDVLRNHFIPGEVSLQDVARRKGGVYSMDQRFINVGEPRKNHFTVDGHEVLSQDQGVGNVFYTIDGVIANGVELAEFKVVRAVPMAAVRTDEVVTEYEPAAGPSTVTKRTTVTRTVVEPVPVPVQ